MHLIKGIHRRTQHPRRRPNGEDKAKREETATFGSANFQLELTNEFHNFVGSHFAKLAYQATEGGL